MMGVEDQMVLMVWLTPSDDIGDNNDGDRGGGGGDCGGDDNARHRYVPVMLN